MKAQQQMSFEFGPKTAVSGDVGLDVPQLRARLEGRDVFAFYSKIRSHKDTFVDLLVEKHSTHIFVYLCPKVICNYLKERYPRFLVVPIEHFTQKDVFLRINDLAGPSTVIIMENISRYTVLSSDKFNFLHRLRMATQKRYLIDIVPFTKRIDKLYLPFSYLDRDILGYSNGYAFQYNYLEEDRNGRIRKAHDFDFIAEKIAPWCYIDYSAFLPDIAYVDSTLTAAEVITYVNRKAVLFDEYDNPQKIVTELCDCANMMESRYQALHDALYWVRGETIVFTNIVKNNPLIKRYLRGRVVGGEIAYKTYMTHNSQPLPFDNVVVFESPLNQNQVGILDVLADVRPGARVFYFRNNAKADQYIFNEINMEWQAINTLTIAMKEAQNAALS